MRVLRVKQDVHCDQWRAGMCLAPSQNMAPQFGPAYCPRARAAYAPGECCAHPQHRPSASDLQTARVLRSVYRAVEASQHQLRRVVRFRRSDTIQVRRITNG